MENKQKVSDNEILLKSISHLSGMQFVIPDYQRGYRWNEVQVIQMLDDIYEFCSGRNKKENGEFYCLQPVVIRRRTTGEYEVIDGQQRLTTIFIILKYLAEVCRLLYPKFELYSLVYETRPESAEFLKNIGCGKVDADNNIDFYFMQQVYDVVKAWFESDDKEVDRGKFLQTLLASELQENENGGQEDIANNVRIIWYETADRDAEPIELFTRLNIGKIPLTNSELVKALLLSRRNFAEQEADLLRLRIATEWNLMEQKLQNDSFWYFLYRSTNRRVYDNRIEFVFDLMQKRDKKQDREYYHTFNGFKKEYDNSGGNAEVVWKAVKDYFLTLEEWYEDRELYHYIGFLIEYGEDIDTLCEESKRRNKDEFHDYIDSRICDKMKDCDINDMDYSASAKARKVLLLFNILTILETSKSEMRFPFNKYKTENWDIEHICSQTDKVPNSLKEWKRWAEDLRCFFSSNVEHIVSEDAHGDLEELDIEMTQEERTVFDKLKKVIETEKMGDKEKEEFEKLSEQIGKLYGEADIKERDNISNLTLLDAETNRSYGNAIFPVKRMYIIDNDKCGKFVPIVTKNAFLKYYSVNVKKMMQWTEADAQAYLKAMEDKLKNYLISNN